MKKMEGRLKDIWGAGEGGLRASGCDHPGEEQVPRPWGVCGEQGTVRTPGCWESGDAGGSGAGRGFRAYEPEESGMWGAGARGSRAYGPEESGDTGRGRDAAGRGRAGVPGLRARRTVAFTWGPRRRHHRVLAESGLDREQAHRWFSNFGIQLMLPHVCRLLLGRPQGCLCCGSLERSTPRAGVCLERPQLLTQGGVFTFCSHHSACGILVPQAGAEPSGKCGVLTTGPHAGPWGTFVRLWRHHIFWGSSGRPRPHSSHL